MVTKIIACGDIHIPSYKGIEQIRPVIETFLAKCKKIAKEEGPENIRIVVLGDIFDQKIAITNESLLCVDWFFSELDKIAKTIVIAGNHDFLMNNTDRVDSLTPLFEIGKYKNVVYLDRALDYKSGIVDDENVAWCLYSSFDGFTTPDIEVHKTAHEGRDAQVYVGLIHTDINGAITLTNYVTENGIDPGVFDGCDFVMAGHIHKRQEIKKNGVRCVYCSSLKQKDFGESISGHGFVLWDIEDPEEIAYKYVDVENPDSGFFRFDIKDISDLDEDKEELTNY